MKGILGKGGLDKNLKRKCSGTLAKKHQTILKIYNDGNECMQNPREKSSLMQCPLRQSGDFVYITKRGPFWVSHV